MAKSSAHKDKIFSLFKDGGFKVNLFYKPTMKDGDIFYHIILDSVLKIRLRLLNENIINIAEVVPLTSEYLETKYDLLVKTLINQTDFTIIIERLGNTQCLNNACVKLGLPCEIDDRFISIPKKLYNMYLRYYKDDESKCGFYIAAVVEDLSNVEIEEDVVEEPEVIIKEVPVEVEKIKIVEKIIEKYPDEKKIDLMELPIDERVLHVLGNGFRLVQKLNDVDGTFSISYMNIIRLEFRIINSGLEILNVTIEDGVTPPSNIYYMHIFECVENILNYFNVSILNVRNETVYNICKIREYDRIQHMSASRRSFGSYKVKKYS